MPEGIMDPVTQHTPKKQHYVPQFLLRNFAIDNTEKLFTYNKQKDICFKTTVRDSASENGFYNIQLSDSKFTLEHKLGSLESLASETILKICTDESLSNINDEEHQILCFFTANLLLRVKRQRVFTSQLNAEMAKFVREVGYEPDELSNFKELSQDDVYFQHINFVNKKLLKFANKFGDKAVGLLEAPKGKAFIISDNPVVMYCHKPDQFNSKGVSVHAVEIFLPISKKLCISFLCMDFYHELSEKLEFIKDNSNQFSELKLIDTSYGELIVNSIQTGEKVTINEKHIEYINSLQITDSWSYIYNDNSDFNLAKSLIKKNDAISSSNIVKVGI